MNDVGIGATIARERRTAGVTQAQLAERLGVTKAAVSKWELGQSLPDVALLPRIAAYFGISLDDLFAFRPQLAEDEVRDVYLELCRLFAEDADAAYARMDELVRDYASCWSLLLQMASLYSQRSLVEPERAEELLDRTCSLAERVEANADDVELVRSLFSCLGTACVVEEDAIDAVIADELDAVLYGRTLESWISLLFQIAPDGLGVEEDYLEPLMDFKGI